MSLVNTTWIECLKETFDQASYKERKELIAKAEELGFEDVAEELRASVCPDCLGTGEVDDYQLMSDPHEYVWEGLKKCHCTYEK